MKYICQIYLNEQEMAAMPTPQVEALDAEHHACDDALAESGHMIFTGALQPSNAAACVRVRNGRTAVTDGPFAETKEQLLGFYVVDCANLDEVLGIAKDLAAANPGGAYEIRPIGMLAPGGAGP